MPRVPANTVPSGASAICRAELMPSAYSAIWKPGGSDSFANCIAGSGFCWASAGAIVKVVTITAAMLRTVKPMVGVMRPPLCPDVNHSRGESSDACLYGPGRDEADCVLDASASRGTIDRYIWTGGAVIGHSTPQTHSALTVSKSSVQLYPLS